MDQPALSPSYALTTRRRLLPERPSPYTHVWRSETFKIWKPIIALVVGVVGFFLISFVVVFIGSILMVISDPSFADNHIELDAAAFMSNPWIFASNNIALGLLIPASLLLSYLIFRQPAGFLTSVVGRFRWRWFFSIVWIVAIVWIVQFAFELWASDALAEAHVRSHTVPVLLTVIFTTPFQAAGEEFAFRGIVNRSVASLIPNHNVGAALGAIVSSVVFMASHAAADPWLNLYYFLFGIAACVLVQLTGGLEASIAIHVINNWIGEILLPFVDMSNAFDRSAGTGGPAMLINMAVFVAVVAVLCWRASKRSIQRLTDPNHPRAFMTVLVPASSAAQLGTFPAPQMPAPQVSDSLPDVPTPTAPVLQSGVEPGLTEQVGSGEKNADPLPDGDR